MPDVYVYPRDPGRELRTSRGSVINLLKETQRSPDAGVGVSVLGVIGTPLTDRGVPNVPVTLSGIQDIFARWGGFSPNVGDGAAAGYNGNVAALLWSLPAARVVFQPVNMEARNDDGEVLKLAFDRRFAITGAESTEVVTTDRPHGIEVGDIVTFAAITGGAGATWTGDKTVATVPSATTLTLTGVTFTTNITVGTMIASARDAYTLPAGSVVTDGSTFQVRTLEDATWVEDDSDDKEVRFAVLASAVGNEAGIDTLTDFAVTNNELRSRTVSTDEPVPMDAAAILFRYQAALDALNVNDAGAGATVVITDRTEAAIADALATHCATASAEGIFRLAVVSPPVGLSAEDAEAASGDGVTRATLNGDYAIYVHPGVRRRFPLDADNLTAADDYKATFPAHALLAAKMLNVRPEENPTYVEAEPGVTYGVAEIEFVLTREQKVTHYEAGICSTVLERLGARRVCAWRDGIMASGVKIARKRLEDFLAANLIARLTPWHKRLATPANQQGALDACDTWLQSLAPDRIYSHALSASWDGETEEFRVDVDVVELGNMDVLTIGLAVSARGFTLITTEEAA